MKTKNYGAFALAAVLLITAALVISCPEPMGPSGWSPLSRARNTGNLTINFGEVLNSRTLLPESPDFLYYEVGITGISPAVTTINYNTSTHGSMFTDDTTNTDPNYQKTFTHTLSPGTYTVDVRAYTSADNTVLAASGSKNNVQVADNSVSVDIQLKENDNTGTGNFKWKITYPTNATTATMILYDKTGAIVSSFGNTVGTTDGKQNLLLTNANNNVDGPGASTGAPLSSGYYLATVLFSGSGVDTDSKTEAVHIYQGQTTQWVETFDPLVRNVYTITYSNYNGIGGSDNTTQTGVTHGATITNSYPNPTDSGTPTKTWDKWYKDSLHTVPWKFQGETDADIVIADTTLYGRWLSSQTVTVTITYIEPDNQTIGFSPITPLAQADARDIEDYSISIVDTESVPTGEAPPDDYEDVVVFTNIIWTYTVGPNLIMDNTSGNTLTLDFTDSDNVDLLRIGPHTISVSATYKDGKTYSGSITLSITAN